MANGQGENWEEARCLLHLFVIPNQGPQTSTVQVRNRTTGAAMILSKKCNANNRLPANSNNRRQSSRPVGLAVRANSSDVKLERPRAVN